MVLVGLVTAAVTACSPQGEPPQDPGQRFICADERSLDIIRSKQLAIVKLGERIFNLDAKKSTIGERYTDGNATLIIDGITAVFVSGDGRDALNCELLKESDSKSGFEAEPAQPPQPTSAAGMRRG
jgi:hypothetical protein